LEEATDLSQGGLFGGGGGGGGGDIEDDDDLRYRVWFRFI
jgi:hypothetical protein